MSLFELRALLLGLPDDVLDDEDGHFAVMRHQVVRTFPAASFLNVMCLPDLASVNPLALRISITLRCGSGLSLAMEDAIRDGHRDVRQG